MRRKGIISTIIMFLLITLMPVYAYADDESEIKSNQNYMYTIPAGTTKEVNYVVPDNGILYFVYTGVESGITATVKKGYQDIDYVFNFCAGEQINSYYHSVKKGTKLRIVLTSEAHGYEEYSKGQIKAVFKKCKNFEKESNNSKSKATGIKLNTAFQGIVNSYYDSDRTDWYVYKVTKTGKYNVQAVVTEQHSGLTNDVDVIAYNGKKKIGELSFLSDGDGWKNISTNYVKLKKGQKIYINVKSAGGATGYVSYKVKVKRKK